MRATPPYSAIAVTSISVRTATFTDPQPSTMALLDAAVSNVACYTKVDAAAAEHPAVAAPGAPRTDATPKSNVAKHPPRNCNDSGTVFTSPSAAPPTTALSTRPSPPCAPPPRPTRR